MADTRFSTTDYPHGCRCARCGGEFTEGDLIVRRPMGEMAGLSAVTPVCSDACFVGSLQPGHPLAANALTLRADGLVDAHG